MALGNVNIWRFAAVDKDGEVFESAPGMRKFLVHGPATKRDLIAAAHLLLNAKRLDAIRAGIDDPGYKLDESSIEPVGHSDAELGQWRPDGAMPLNLPTDPAVRASHEKLIAEKLGVNPDAL